LERRLYQGRQILKTERYGLLPKLIAGLKSLHHQLGTVGMLRILSQELVDCSCID